MNNLILITVGIFFLVLLWAASIGFTYWDAVSRRRLSGIETAAWIVLVMLIPGIGFAAYLFTRLLGSALSPNQPGVQKSSRVTMLKPPLEPHPRSGTIAAADFLQPYTTETMLSPAASAGLQKGGPKYSLSIIAGPNIGEEYILESFPVDIGRGPDVSISLIEDRGVSRLHAEIYEKTGVLRIRDMKSTHGTQVNGINIQDKSLEPGDQIRVGVSVLRFGVQEKSE